MKSEQQRLIAAIFAGEGISGFEPKGLAIYQRNLQATALRALEITYPTVEQLIGKDLFRYAANRLLVLSPLAAGDWGTWGADFGDLLDHLIELEDYPYVADCARLDFRVHLANRAADSSVDVSSLQLLGTASTDRLRLTLSDGVGLLASDYPIVDIWMAHHDQHGSARRWIDAAQEKMTQGVGQTALVYRRHYRSHARAVGSAERDWLQSLEEGVSLADALERARQTGFEFEQWLPQAVADNLISNVERH